MPNSGYITKTCIFIKVEIRDYLEVMLVMMH